MSQKLSMVPILVQSRDVPAGVRANLRTFLEDPTQAEAGCDAARGLMNAFELSQHEVMDLMGFEACPCS